MELMIQCILSFIKYLYAIGKIITIFKPNSYLRRMKVALLTTEITCPIYFENRKECFLVIIFMKYNSILVIFISKSRTTWFMKKESHTSHLNA